MKYPNTIERAIALLPRRYPAVARAWIAFSGGPDSTALLYLAARHLAPAWTVQAIHVEHGLQAPAADWAAHCEQVCRRLEVPLRVTRVAVEATGNGLEAAAREARYRALADALAADDVLLTAHHRDDQVETFLIQAMRGTGIDGLAAMPEARPLGRGLHLRPLLAFGRDELQAVVAASGLPVVHDPMNRDEQRERGFLRERLLPMLESRRPGVRRTLARTARLCASAGNLIDDVVQRQLQEIRGPDPAMLDLDALSLQPETLHAELIRAWLRERGLAPPAERQLNELLEQIHAAPDRDVTVSWPGVEVRRYRRRLVASAPLRFPQPDTVLDWCSARLELPAGIGELHWQRQPPGPGHPPGVQVRFRSGGEQIHPHGHEHTRTLKNLFQEIGIPPWERRRTPLIYQGGELLAVADLWSTDAFERMQSERGIRLVFRRHPPSGNGA